MFARMPLRSLSLRFALILLLTLTVLQSVPAHARTMAAEHTLTVTSPLVQQREPVTVYIATVTRVSTFDPQVAEDTHSVTPIENLFLGLTDIDPFTNTIRPEMAIAWEQSEDGTVWTYTLRDDVPWVRYDPATGETTRLGVVTAHDFVYGIRRACDPRTGGYYSTIAAAIIEGCAEALGMPLDEITTSTFDSVGVEALSDIQLRVTLRSALSFWESTSGMWMFRAVPREAIDAFGDRWTEPGNIVTNGPYMLEAFDPGVSRVFVANPYFPEGVSDRYGGNIERLEIIAVDSPTTVFSLYEANESDIAPVPGSELDRIRRDRILSQELRQRAALTVYYFSFSYDRPPFDNVHARRAFSAVIDRAALVDGARQGQGIPMAHFVPPGLFGAVPVNEIGVGQPDTPGMDLDYAREQLALAGFPDCEGLPEIRIFTFIGAAAWAETLQDALQTHLGCDGSRLVIEELEFTVLLRTTSPDTPTPERPHLWTYGWVPDYPDANNYFHDVLSCQAENAFKRPCDDRLDGMIEAARAETDAARRVQLYRELEEAFFGYDGEFTIAPLFMTITTFMVKPWYSGPFETDGLFGGQHWDAYRIDQEAQRAARP